MEDLATMLLEYYGKIIVQPYHDLVEKATAPRISQSSAAGFMTRAEADADMESAKQAKLISVHANRTALTGKPPFNNKKSKGRGGSKGRGRKGFPLGLLPQQQKQQRST